MERLLNFGPSTTKKHAINHVATVTATVATWLDDS
jgi:hypothetical protein